MIQVCVCVYVYMHITHMFFVCILFAPLPNQFTVGVNASAHRTGISPKVRQNLGFAHRVLMSLNYALFIIRLGRDAHWAC